jgi:hypothetical protein
MDGVLRAAVGAGMVGGLDGRCLFLKGRLQAIPVLVRPIYPKPTPGLSLPGFKVVAKTPRYA